MSQKYLTLIAAFTASFALSPVSHAQEPISEGNFIYGYNTSDWANDGECDDPRFMGPGVADELVDADLFQDGADCKAAVDAGSIWLVSPNNVDFGDDSGMFTNDDECDDPRFRGAGMTSTELLESDIRADATDCRSAYLAGGLTYIGTGISSSQVNFGDDNGEWTNDDECDDPRFAGAGMTMTPLNEEDQGHDASDCQTAFNAGELALR